MWGNRGNWSAEPQHWDSPVSEGRWRAGNRRNRRAARGEKRVMTYTIYINVKHFCSLKCSNESHPITLTTRDKS